MNWRSGLRGLAALAAVSLVMGAVTRAEPLPEDATHSEGELGQWIVEYVRASGDRGFSGVVLAADEGRVIAAAGVGTADPEGNVPNTPATLFEIASLTKQFTAAGAMRLAQEGRLELSDPIAKWIPGVPDHSRGVTLEHLLRHTSGIPRTNGSGRGDRIEEVLGSFLRGGPRHQPGTRFEYWNQGYAIATEVIARAAGSPWTDFCREALFEPAGMHATRFTGDEAPDGTTVAIGSSTRGAPRSALDHPYGDSYGFQYRGMGGVVTSVWDLWRWDRALDGDRILNDDSKSVLFEAGPGNYALGWGILRSSNGTVVQMHGGSVRGFLSMMIRVPKDDQLVVALANRDDAPIRDVTYTILRAMQGSSFMDRFSLRPLPPVRAGSIAGRYRNAFGMTLIVESIANVMYANVDFSPLADRVTQGVIGLNEDGELVFHDGESEGPLELRDEQDGMVREIAISLPRELLPDGDGNLTAALEKVRSFRRVEEGEPGEQGPGLEGTPGEQRDGQTEGQRDESEQEPRPSGRGRAGKTPMDERQTTEAATHQIRKLTGRRRSCRASRY